MAEFLIKATSANWMDDTSKWTAKSVTQEMYDKRSLKGDIFIVRDNKHPWGKCECPPQYVVIKVPDLDWVKMKAIIEQGLYDLVVKDNISATISAEDWDATYGKEIIPTKAERVFTSVPTIINTIHKLGGISSYEVKGQAWVSEMRKKRTYTIPTTLVDEAIKNEGTLEIKTEEMIGYINKRTLDTAKAITTTSVSAQEFR